jgi:hypothetical protein
MNEQMDSFIGLSAVLTGFAASVLAPALDPVDIKSTYLPVFSQKIAQESGDPNLVARLFQKFEVLKAQKLPDQAIGEAMLDPANGEAFVTACRKLVFMWYSGAWPTLVTGSDGKPATVSDLISDKTYTAGLVWQVMQSHPMGDSNYRYGYWAATPPPLDAYTGQQGEA